MGLLVSLHEEEITIEKIKMLLFGTIVFFSIRSLAKDIKKLIESWRVLPKGLNKLQIHDVSQDKLCIICYSNCRNLIIFDCMHLIMCQDCFEEGEMKECPICKKAVTLSKPIFEYGSL